MYLYRLFGDFIERPAGDLKKRGSDIGLEVRIIPEPLKSVLTTCLAASGFGVRVNSSHQAAIK